MKRPQRRLHLMIWIVLAPTIAAGLALALWRAPPDLSAEPSSDLADIAVTGEAD